MSDLDGADNWTYCCKDCCIRTEGAAQFCTKKMCQKNCKGAGRFEYDECVYTGVMQTEFEETQLGCNEPGTYCKNHGERPDGLDWLEQYSEYRCAPLEVNGEHCEENNQCLSGHCHLNSTHSLEQNFCYQCIAAANGRDMKSLCYEDEYCNSETWSCHQQKQSGEECNSRYACMSGHCLDTKCVSCDVDSDCAHYSIESGLVICHDGKCIEWEKVPEEAKQNP